MVMCDKTIEETKTVFLMKKLACKTLYFLLAFLLITIALLTAVSIYCCLIKY